MTSFGDADVELLRTARTSEISAAEGRRARLSRRARAMAMAVIFGHQPPHAPIRRGVPLRRSIPVLMGHGVGERYALSPSSEPTGESPA